MPTRLIIVPCHSVWKFGTQTTESPFSSKYEFGETADQWVLAPFQYEGNDHLSFIAHSLRAIVELMKDLKNNVVIFSGSQTKVELGPMSEAQSYYYLTYKIINAFIKNKPMPDCFQMEIIPLLKQIVDLFEQQPDEFTLSSLFVPNLITTEEFALDSFDNLLYSIARFKETTTLYPDYITVCGFGFKEERFLQFHSKAIDFPIDRINCISYGPNPNYNTKDEIDKYFTNLKKAENKNALSLFAKDWYGTCDPLLNKKVSRNLYHRTARYEILDTMHLNGQQITACESHFDLYIKNKMPWSINKL